MACLQVTMIALTKSPTESSDADDRSADEDDPLHGFTQCGTPVLVLGSVSSLGKEYLPI
jgi:hypothetical protein